MWNIVWLFRNLVVPGCHVPLEFSICLIIPKHTPFKNEVWSLNFTMLWWCHDVLCYTILPVLTNLGVKFEISSTVPGFSISNECNLNLFAVEHKNFRIRHNILYVKMLTAQLFWKFQPFVWPNWKLRINVCVKIKVERYFFPSQYLRQARVYRVSAVALKLLTYYYFTNFMFLLEGLSV
jgi:hypothetical protein